MAPAKKSKAQRLDERAYSVSIPKKKTRIAAIYNGDQMVLRNKRQLLLRHNIGGCYIAIKRQWSVEALRWLTRGGQSVRLPPIRIPNERMEPIEENQNDQNEVNQGERCAPGEPDEFGDLGTEMQQPQQQAMIANENGIQLAILDSLQQEQLEYVDMNHLNAFQSSGEPGEGGEVAEVKHEQELMIVDGVDGHDNQLEEKQPESMFFDINTLRTLHCSESSESNPPNQNEVEFNQGEPGKLSEVGRKMQQQALHPQIYHVDNADSGDDVEVATPRPQPIPPMPKRRFSTAGGMLFSVNEMPRETGFDYLTKKTVDSNIIAHSSEVYNNFDPFIRIENPPFALRGRKRSASQDCFVNRFEPTLNAIKE